MADCRILSNMTPTHHLNNDAEQMKEYNAKYFKFMDAEIKNRAIYSNSINNGLSIFETSTIDRKAVAEFNKFIEELQK